MSCSSRLYALSFKAQLKPLFSDRDARLRSRALINELKAHLLVKMPCGIEPRKGTKIDAAVFLGATEVDGSVDKSSANGHYEPPKMRAGVSGVHTVNSNGDSTRPETAATQNPSRSSS